VQPPKRTELGAVVPKSRATPNLHKDWKTAIEYVISRSFVSRAVADELDAAFEAFLKSYTEALKALANCELAGPALGEQSTAWSQLLEKIGGTVRAEAARIQLLRPLLRIGIAEIRQPEDNLPAALVCPWQPLRLEALAASERRLARQLAELVH